MYGFLAPTGKLARGVWGKTGQKPLNHHPSAQRGRRSPRPEGWERDGGGTGTSRSRDRGRGPSLLPAPATPAPPGEARARPERSPLPAAGSAALPRRPGTGGIPMTTPGARPPGPPPHPASRPRVGSAPETRTARVDRLDGPSGTRCPTGTDGHPGQPAPTRDTAGTGAGWGRTDSADPLPAALSLPGPSVSPRLLFPNARKFDARIFLHSVPPRASLQRALCNPERSSPVPHGLFCTRVDGPRGVQGLTPIDRCHPWSTGLSLSGTAPDGVSPALSP